MNNSKELDNVKGAITDDILKEISVLGKTENCIEVSVFAARLLTLQGIEAYPMEAFASVVPNVNEGGESGAYGIGSEELKNERGVEWHGHMVVHVPGWNEIIDLTLDFQNCAGMNQMMMDVGGVPGTGFCASTKYDPATGRSGDAEFANGFIRWKLYPEAESWKDLDANLKAVEDLADHYFEIIKEQERGMGESIS